MFLKIDDLIFTVRNLDSNIYIYIYIILKEKFFFEFYFMQLIVVRTCVKPVFEWGIISAFCTLQIRTVKGLIFGFFNSQPVFIRFDF